MPDPSICVIIPAFNAAETVARAAASALAEPEVAEVCVVDDASTDGTAAAARQADDGSGRLRVETLARNQGPSAARNHALARSQSPLVAVLDSDDFFLPGRFSRLLDAVGNGWDLAADNIVMVPEDDTDAARSAAGPGEGRVRDLSLAEFVRSNISRPGRPRAELGFMKPLIRRDAMERLGLGYDPAMRLGEDFRLYAEALLRGACFRLSERAGYVATIRKGSLSSMHRKADLEALAAADRRLIEEARARGCPSQTISLLHRHLRSVELKIAVRAFLEDARERGRWRSVMRAATNPPRAAAIAATLVLDRLGGRRMDGARSRMLFPPSLFANPAQEG